MAIFLDVLNALQNFHAAQYVDSKFMPVTTSYMPRVEHQEEVLELKPASDLEEGLADHHPQRVGVVTHQL